MRSRKLKDYLALILLAACVSCFAPQLLRAQDSDDDDSNEPQKPFVNLGISISPDNTARVTVSALVVTGSAKDLLPEVEALLGCKLQQDRVSQTQVYVFNGSCQIDTAKSGMLRTKTISLNRLTEVVKNHGAQSFSLQIYLPDAEVSETLPPAPAPSFPIDKLPARVGKQMVLTAAYAWTDLGGVPAAIRIQYGYRQATLARTAAILAGFLFLPLIFVSWLGRRALSAPPDRAASVWFSYMRYLSWTLNLSLIGWFATVEAFDCRELLQFVFSAGQANYTWIPAVSYEVLMWCTPVVIWISCLVLSKSVQEKLRGVSWTQSELALQALYSFCGSFIPLAMWIGAFVSLTSGTYRTAVFLFAGALIVKLFAKGKLAKLLGMQPHALTSGDLRDVAFAIAQRLGVPLQQIYLIPSGKGRMANAFARTGNTIAFTDYLLSQMTKREVNFVVAHELTHLQKKHPNKLAGIVGGVAAGLTMVVTMFRSFLDLSSYFTYAAIIVASTVITYTFTRRFEYEADAGAVAATGDPQAAICALFKLAQLNLHPLQWSRWSEKWITHPSMMRRVRAIAVRAQIPEVSIPDIAARGVEPRLHYPIPDDSQRKGKVLSTISRTRSLRWAVFLLLGVALLPPAICAFSAQIFPAVSAHRFLVYALGFAIAIGLHFLISSLAPAWMLRPLLERMKNKLESERAVQTEAWGGIPVGLAPADRPRVYEGMTHWDLGFLFLRSDRICYVGEEAAFSLRCDQVTDLRLGPGNPNWLRNQRIYLAWRDEARQASGVFSIAAANAEPATKLRARTVDLFQQLNRWRNTRAASRPLPEPLTKLESPQFREVTSQAPGASLEGKKFFNELFLTGLFAVAIALLFGLPFHLMAYLNGVALPGQNPFPGAGAGWYVLTAGLAIRLFQVAPLLFYKDRPVSSVAPLGVGVQQTPRKETPGAPQQASAAPVLEEK